MKWHGRIFLGKCTPAHRLWRKPSHVIISQMITTVIIAPQIGSFGTHFEVKTLIFTCSTCCSLRVSLPKYAHTQGGVEIDGPAMRKLVTRLSEERIQKKAISLKVFCCICAFVRVVMFAFVTFYYWVYKIWVMCIFCIGPVQISQLCPKFWKLQNWNSWLLVFVNLKNI